MNKIVSLSLVFVIVLASLSGCTTPKSGPAAGPVSSPSGSPTILSPVRAAASATPTATGASAGAQATASHTMPAASATQPQDAAADYPDATVIALGDVIALQGQGASVKENAIYITSGGVYLLSGTLTEGQIIVDAQNKTPVTLLLDGVDITCSSSAPIYVKQSQSATIILAQGSENRLADGASYLLDDAEKGEPDAALFSKDDLIIEGSGSLRIDARYDDGVASKDGLEIKGGVIVVNAAGDGIRGRNHVTIFGGDITINAGKDGIKSTHDEDAEKGFVSIEGGSIAITAGEDGIQAETKAHIRSGTIAIVSGEGSANASANIGSAGNTWGRWPAAPSAKADDTTPSAKGIKAKVSVVIDDGLIRVDSSDDAIHSNGSIVINGGDIALASGDDGVHADASIDIIGGNLSVAKSYEAIESATITIRGGNLHLVASDDGINVAGGNDGSSLMGRPGQNTFAPSSNQYLHILGGQIVVDATGDGIDVNGAIEMSGGVVIVHGPTANNNGALDYDRGFKITGGVLVAAGSAGMAQAPDASSSQNVVMVNFTSIQPAGSLVHIAAQNGEELLTFAPLRQYQSVVFSSAKLTSGAGYTVHTGGSSAASETDGLYDNGGYRGGVAFADFVLSGIVTGVGAAAGFRGGPGGMPGGGGPGGRR